MEIPASQALRALEKVILLAVGTARLQGWPSQPPLPVLQSSKNA
jgi:hypothetical protein